MARDEFEKARADVDRKTSALSDQDFALVTRAIVEEARESHPVPSSLLGVIYRSSAQHDLSEVSLTPVS